MFFDDNRDCFKGTDKLQQGPIDTYLILGHNSANDNVSCRDAGALDTFGLDNRIISSPVPVPPKATWSVAWIIRFLPSLLLLIPTTWAEGPLVQPSLDASNALAP